MSVDWKLHNRGFVSLRNSPEVIARLQQHASEIASRAGEGFETRPPETNRRESGRARVAVVTSSFEAMHAQATESVLTRAVGGSSVWPKKGGRR